MKITLVQAEIEDAIKEYLGNQMTIAKGMAITIDLRATRGDDGYMALVDIRKDVNWIPKLETTHPDPEVIETTKAYVPTPKAEVAKPAIVEETFSTESDAEEEASVEPDQTEDVLPEVAEIEVAKAAPVAEKLEGKATRAGGRSLFGGLKKPNS